MPSPKPVENQPRADRSKRKKWAVFGTLGIATVALLYWNSDRRDAGEEAKSATAVTAAITPSASSPMEVQFDSTQEALMKLLGQLRSRPSVDEVGAALAEMETLLRRVHRDEAVRALLAFLDSGANVETRLGFRVGPGGNLSRAPTLRVWILDQLGRLDRAAAASYSARIYMRHDSADEWAVALRNDWREAAPKGRIEPVRARVLELLADAEWAKQPSAGFLESLDVCVATMAWEAVPRLEQWMEPTQPRALRSGAWIALDRLAMEVPADFLPLLAQSRDWLASQPLLRAGLIARADLSAESGKSVVESYLQRDDVTALEGQRFFELLPNVSATVSHNLVTTARTPSAPQAARLDQAALASVREWRAQPRFSRWDADLVAAEVRLAESVASAIRGGYLHP